MAAETSRMKQLRSLSSSIPGANQKVTKGLQEGQNLQLQESIKASPTAGPQAAQNLGAATAAGKQQAALQQNQKAQQQQVQVGQMGLQQQGIESRDRVATEARDIGRETRDLENRLETLGQDYKNELVDNQLEFTRDEQGRALMNERQLADYKISTAQDAVELQKWAQTAQQAHERKIQVLKTAQAQVDQALKQGYIIKGQKLDFESKKQMVQYKQDLEEKQRKAQAAAANKMAAWQAGGTIFGAVAGGILGGPGGGKAGAGIGGGAGTAAGGAFG